LKAVIVWLFVVLAAAGVFAVAAVAVGRETFRLGHQLPASILDMNEAVQTVALGLPEGVQGRLSYDDVRVLVSAHLDDLQEQGIVGREGQEPEALTGAPGGDGDGEEVVVREEEALAYVLGQADEAGLDVSDEDAYAVMRALRSYLGDIGAIGPTAT
jgi:hypothetical protein